MAAKSGILFFLYALWYFTESFLKSCVYFFVPLSLRRRKNVAGEIVLVTGGGNGLGRQLAVEFAKLGATVVSWDVDRRGNQETARIVRELDGVGGGVRAGGVHTYTVDIGDANAVNAAADKVRREIGDVTILVNNAGIAHYKPTLECSDELLQKIMNVNALSHFRLYKAFLPAMKAHNSGHIVTIASIISFLPYRFMGAYSSSKCTVAGIHESLEFDLAFESSGIKMTMVHPTGMSTNMITGRINTNEADTVSPQEAARIIVEGVLLERSVVCVPNSLYIVTIIKNLIPVKLLKMAIQSTGLKTVFLQNNETSMDTDNAGDKE